MQFHVLRESPDNSGTYVETGEIIDLPAEAAVEHALQLTTDTGSRHAVFAYDSVRRERTPTPAAPVEAAPIAEPVRDPDGHPV